MKDISMNLIILEDSQLEKVVGGRKVSAFQILKAYRPALATHDFEYYRVQYTATVENAHTGGRRGSPSNLTSNQITYLNRQGVKLIS